MPVADITTALPQLEVLFEGTRDMYDVIVIGGGPAGLTAAITTGRARLKTLVLEKTLLGGHLSVTDLVESFPGVADPITGHELTLRLEEQARAADAEIAYRTVTNISKEGDTFQVMGDGQIFKTRSVIIASGSKAQELNVKGEQEFRGRGVSYYAICDGVFYRGKRVAVIGRGDTAIRDSLFLTKFVDKVYIIHWKDRLKSERILAENATDNPKISFSLQTTIEEIKGTSSVDTLVLKDLRTQEVRDFPIDGVFICVGKRPESEFLADLLEKDSRNYVISNEEMKTSVPGIFAIGDVRKKPFSHLLSDMSDGAVGAISVIRYLRDRE